MSNIKLQVGEDYLNSKFESIHIQSFSNTENYYRDKSGTRYNEDGTVFIFKGKSDYDLITHVPKYTPKEPTNEEINIAAIKWLKSGDINYHVGNSWKAAIEWYKQQIDKGQPG